MSSPYAKLSMFQMNKPIFIWPLWGNHNLYLRGLKYEELYKYLFNVSLITIYDFEFIKAALLFTLLNVKKIILFLDPSIFLSMKCFSMNLITYFPFLRHKTLVDFFSVRFLLLSYSWLVSACKVNVLLKEGITKWSKKEAYIKLLVSVSDLYYHKKAIIL